MSEEKKLLCIVVTPEQEELLEGIFNVMKDLDLLQLITCNCRCAELYGHATWLQLQPQDPQTIQIPGIPAHLNGYMADLPILFLWALCH